ncbi:tetratricopeptide repeat protein [Cupriavidus sp. TMH.W2]|uniref:tetratricopeptide repeat protein n=1 Tax=Cupriavidus sp. TMH.W2 TaxID=3434465 RepID=UPI003D779E07
MRPAGLTVRDIQAMLGVTRGMIGSLMSAGLVEPHRGGRGEFRFSFQDAVLIRTAHSLRTAHISWAQILRALRRLREFNNERHLSAVRITAVGNRLAAREGSKFWLIDSGQYVIPLEAESGSADVVLLGGDGEAADEHHGDFVLACELEAADPSAAEAAYRRAIQAAPAFRDAYLNLGCLLVSRGRHADAAEIYRLGLEQLHDDPTLHFNLGVVLEDLGAAREAVVSYDRCIELAPDDADAHYNAARLHQELGDSHRAIRHFNQYRRLERP